MFCALLQNLLWLWLDKEDLAPSFGIKLNKTEDESILLVFPMVRGLSGVS